MDMGYYWKHREAQKANALQNQNAKRSALSIIKLDAGCVDCGYNADPVALDFDHVRGTKVKDISQMGLVAALEEIEKCEVRCANCHRIRSVVQRRG